MNKSEVSSRKGALSRRMQSQVTAEGSDEVKILTKYVGIPGAIGGSALTAWSMVDPSYQVSSNILVNIPVYSYLGFVSAIIATKALGDIARASITQLIGNGLVYGLIFPTIISNALAKQQIESAAIVAEEKVGQIQQEQIQQLQEFATNTTDIKVRKRAIASVEELAQETDDAELKQQAVEAINEVSQAEQPISVELSGLQSLKDIAISSQDPVVVDRLITSISNYGVPDRLKAVKAQYIKEIKNHRANLS